MKKNILRERIFAHHLSHFIKNEEGVYSIIMAGMGAVLLAIIAFAVDGSGVILDQARLSDSLEQATLAVTSENNAHRKDRYKIIGKDDAFTADLQHQRNEQIVDSYVKAYMPQVKSWKLDGVKCEQKETPYAEVTKCNVSATIVRNAWLPFVFENASTITGDLNIFSHAIAEKVKAIPPLDVMLVADFSGSMKQPLKGGRESKSDILKRVLNKLTDDVFFKDPDSKNRIGITSFATGAQHHILPSSCAFPYQFKNPNEIVGRESLNKYLERNFSKIDMYRPKPIHDYFEPKIDYEKTIEQIDKFDGSAGHYSVTMKSNNFCLGNSQASQYWYSIDKHQEFKTFLAKIRPEGGTLSSSGLLVGANSMLDKKQLRNARDIGVNTQRILVVLSDGKDEFVVDSIITGQSLDTQEKERKFRNITNTLIERGVCHAIRKKLDSLNDSNFYKYPSKIAFIAFGYEPSETNEKAWRDCVGGNFFVVDEEKKLLKTFEKILKVEEVGHSLNR